MKAINARSVIILFAIITIIFCALILKNKRAARIIKYSKNDAQAPTTGMQKQGESAGHPDHIKQNSRAEIIKSMTTMLSTPVEFYGVVLDQFGAPVPNATAEYSLLDKFLASGSVGRVEADDQGAIRITGVRGAVITVGVSKPGYYWVDGKSAMSFAYGTATDEFRLPAPTEKSPAKFLLHKKGRRAALIHAELTNHDIQKDGTAVRIDLATGITSQSGDFLVEAWTSKPERSDTRFYAWRCRVSIPGGGIMERTDPLEFIAPIDGYKDSYEVMQSSDPDQWDSRFKIEYFVRTSDNRYARVKFFFTSGGNHFFWLETHLNPEPGNRNLEFDESIPRP